MSKPVLTFWLEALCMAALGVETSSGEVLLGAHGWAQPEWAVVVCGAVGLPIAWLFHLGIDADVSASGLSLRFAADALVAGPPGNCGLPSQPACTAGAARHGALTPALQALLSC